MPSSFGSLSVSLSLAATLLLTGCSINRQDLARTGATPTAISGHVHGGQSPVTSSTVTLYAAGPSYGSGATVLATTTSDANGNFNFSNAPAYSCPTDTTPVYIIAVGGNPGLPVTDPDNPPSNPNLVLAAGIGDCSYAPSITVDVNEVTTVATAFALSHYFTGTLGTGSDDAIGGPESYGFKNAGASTIPMMVDLPSGAVQPNTSSFTIEAAKIYSLANSLAACVNSAGTTGSGDTTSNCAQLFADTTPPSGATGECVQFVPESTRTCGSNAPSDTLQAAVQIALYPWQNVSAIYNLANAAAPFSGLAAAPNDWTIAASFTASNNGLGIDGDADSQTSSNIDIDAGGTIWFPSNDQSNPGIGNFDPTTHTFLYTYAGDTLVHPQYVTVTPSGAVWASDTRSNNIAAIFVSGAPGTFSVLTHGPTGPIGSVTDSNQGGDAVYFAGAQNGTGAPVTEIYQYDNFNLNDVGSYTQTPNSLVPYDNQGTLYIDAATSGSSTPCKYEDYTAGNQDFVYATSSSSPCYAGGFVPLAAESDALIVTSDGEICQRQSAACFNPPVELDSPKGLAVDGDGMIWVANSSSTSVSTFGYDTGSLLTYPTSPTPYIHDVNNGNTLTMPFGLAIDGGGNVWLSNAGCVSNDGTVCTPGPFTLTEIIGAAAPTITPISVQNNTGSQGVRPGAVPRAASKGRLHVH